MSEQRVWASMPSINAEWELSGAGPESDGDAPTSGAAVATPVRATGPGDADSVDAEELDDDLDEDELDDDDEDDDDDDDDDEDDDLDEFEDDELDDEEDDDEADEIDFTEDRYGRIPGEDATDG